MSIKGRDILTLQELSPNEILNIIDRCFELKNEWIRGLRKREDLEGKSVCLLFERPSTRTRLAFEIAASSLGAHPIYASASELQLARGETISDTAEVLSRMVDCIVARVRSHAFLEELAKHSSVPIINGLSDLHHPTQALTDVFTMFEVKGRRKLKVAFIGDGGANTCHSLLICCSKLGLDIVVACPNEFRPRSSVLEIAMKNSKVSGSNIEIVEDPVLAVKYADVIYTDVFVSMGFEEEREARLKKFLYKYQVNKELLEKALSDYIFMHCLPAKRGEEVTDEVIDDAKHSVVWLQAENKLHMARAILSLVM
ncbi:MAG: ornithine carbamoyltransferase [Candidatus Nezhaarchaeota archaeon]|nr:ornithine carbamoyltransferase [Candidatus Nezhaarchaeota archaeon]MCX8142110.1 ornithine carbamoyltransferase [Candidatus Nezhaarchaeota archaeon]MDW8050109.1 ornithine carbamoyltransferase [Nitrososphaerota archaeon]